MIVYVVEQIEDHAAGWVWGVFSTREKAEAWCEANKAHTLTEITEHVLDEDKVLDPSGGNSQS